MPKLLEGLRVLVLEDDYFGAMEMKNLVEQQGGTVVGPVGRLEEALEIVRSQSLDGAILDIKLDHHDSMPVADELAARGVPVMFASGYSQEKLPDRFAGAPRITKPFTKLNVERVLRRVFGDRDRAA